MADLEAGAGAGAEVDVDEGGLFASIMGRLSLTLETLSDRIARQLDEDKARERRLARLMPVARPLAGVGIATAAGTCSISAGKPELGRLFEVRSLAVGGPTVDATPAGSGFVIASAMNPALDRSLLNLRDVISEALPQVAFYSSNQLTLQQNEHLIVELTGCTSGLQYVVSGIALDYPIDAFLAATI